ncbi:MAG: hypothetical protein H6838_07135 [Planctomycetes bacterium]|nr:hypothetical protein [Planctomycetota bacterium]MCB9885248.1 hypothetical protein [Planctomycetota bacterium]
MSLPPDLQPRVLELLRAEGVDESYLAFVTRHVAEPDSSWRWCCGSSCDPCVTRLARVVDATRILLGYASGGLPADDGKP